MPRGVPWCTRRSTSKTCDCSGSRSTVVLAFGIRLWRPTTLGRFRSGRSCSASMELVRVSEVRTRASSSGLRRCTTSRPGFRLCSLGSTGRRKWCRVERFVREVEWFDPLPRAKCKTPLRNEGCFVFMRYGDGILFLGGVFLRAFYCWLLQCVLFFRERLLRCDILRFFRFDPCVC